MSRLELHGLHVRYGAVAAVRGFDLVAESGKITALLGPNGAGKSTTLLALAGACEGKVSGQMTLDGTNTSGLSAEMRARRGIALVPEGRRIFTRLTVEQNLTLARAGRADRREVKVTEVYDRFPVLRDFATRQAGLLSGGQQQQLAIGRALMMRPTVLLLDEPSLGLSPLMVELVFSAILELKKSGLTILLIEQNVAESLALADFATVLESGKVVLAGTAADVAGNDGVRRAYLGL